MATLQELQTVVAELEIATEAKCLAYTNKIAELQVKKIAATAIPDEIITGLRAAIESTKAPEEQTVVIEPSSVLEALPPVPTTEVVSVEVSVVNAEPLS